MDRNAIGSLYRPITLIIFALIILGKAQEENSTHNKGWTQLTETGSGCSGIIRDSVRNVFVYTVDTNRDNVNFLNIKSWNGETWQDVGEPLKKDITQTQYISDPSLISDRDGKPVVAWSETTNYLAKTDNFVNLWVKRWNGTAWEALGDNLRIDTTKDALFSSLAVDSQNNVLIAWQEGTPLQGQDNISDHSAIYLKRWNGAKWLDVAPPIPGAYPNLAINANNMPVIAYVLEEDTFVKGKVARWNDSSWEYLGDMLNEDDTRSVDPHSLSISFNNDGQPIIASRQDASYKDRKFLVQQWTGDSWQVLDGQFFVNSKNILEDISLYSKGDKIAVAFTEYEDPATSLTAGRFPSPQLYVKVQENGVWELLNNESLGYDVVCPTVWIDEKNRPVVAWSQSDAIAGTSKFVISRFEK
jgi:hypothetical protein